MQLPLERPSNHQEGEDKLFGIPMRTPTHEAHK